MAKFTKKFESAKQEWETPDSLFRMLNTRYHFNFDLAADKGNAKCKRYYSSIDDALSKTWIGSCWLNPPYGGASSNRLAKWVEKAYTESLSNGCNIAMLIPARTNTGWWHRYCMHSKEILFIEGRPKFGGAKYGLPQPLVIVYFSGHNEIPAIGTLKV